MEQFTVTRQSPQVVQVSQARGPEGPPGNQGPAGAQGASIRMAGQWSSGQQYGPLDAVTWRSTVSGAVTSLYIHRTADPSAPVGVPPNEAPSFWSEIGIQSINDAIGGVWRVEQPQHGIVRIGTPVTIENGAYRPASSQVADAAAVAIVRDIPDADTLVLQSDGFAPGLNPAVNVTPPNTWTAGSSYWLSPVEGRVQEVPPAGNVAQIVFRVVTVHGDGSADAVVVMSNDLPIVPAPDPVPAPATTDQKVDDISGQFDGVRTIFDLTVATAPIPYPAAATAFVVYIDGNPQEPLVDFTIIDNGAGNAAISFTEPPRGYELFASMYTLALGVAPSVTFGPTLPVGVPPGTQHFLTTEPTGLYIFFNDGDSSQWVQADGFGSAP